VTEIISEICKA